VGVDAARPESTEAFDTLYTVLETLTRVAAPLLPLVTERVWQGLTGGRSVHLTDWPDAAAFGSADDIRTAMDTVRDVSSVANGLRKKEGKRVRLPLPALTVVTKDVDALAQFEGIVREELNVKSVQLVEFQPTSYDDYGLGQRLVVNARAAGPRLGKRVQQVLQAAKAGAWREDERGIVVHTPDGDVVMEHGEAVLESDLSERPAGEAVGHLTDGFVVLDTTTTPELEAEGLARDIVRAVQDTRKAAGFDVSDRIRLVLTFTDAADAEAVVGAFDVADVAGETLAREASVVGADGSILLARDTLRATPGEVAEHAAQIPAGTYANRGAFTVAVTRTGVEA
jgi:isoleucyl-tRNA synthetase